MRQQIELNPCPWCHALVRTMVVPRGAVDKLQVQCPVCGASGPVSSRSVGTRLPEIADAWNRIHLSSTPMFQKLLNRRDPARIRDSIILWKRLATGRARPKESPYGEHCPLCQRYNTTVKAPHCYIKNVMMPTGYEYCPLYRAYGKCGAEDVANPWLTARDMWEDEGSDSVEFTLAALERVKCLESLLKPSKTLMRGRRSA
jgi:hypothetical protein